MTDWLTSGTWDLGIPEKHRLQAALEAVQGKEILDVGCRDGTFILTLAREHPEINVTGFDTDASAIQWANETAVKLGLDNATFFVDDVTDPKLPWAGRFDSVYCMETLEHVPVPLFQRAHQNVRSFVRPGGRLIVTVPANSHISDPDHKSIFYREIIFSNEPDLIWLKDCPHLWIGFILEFQDKEQK